MGHGLDYEMLYWLVGGVSYHSFAIQKVYLWLKDNSSDDDLVR